ncbi:hypothetical protein D030_3782B, partial [Vibrio parahaemolyticus AQ3810]
VLFCHYPHMQIISTTT